MQPGHDLRKDFISIEEYELLQRKFEYECIKKSKKPFPDNPELQNGYY